MGNIVKAIGVSDVTIRAWAKAGSWTRGEKA